ncbi:LiaF transmembrane domain-containing protein [Pedobacter jamesrossensis]|uniref:LiaF transmembrane domain-containing protein n=1 Tax=Pedobacter jamesrossensis TaxID=1908238 RepID=A0ABV8NK97_9SPHI
MENLIKKNHADKQMGLGILIVVIGAVFLLRNTGVDVPHWVLSWHTVMLGAGLWIGYRKNFQGSGWLALTVIGAIFTLKDITLFDFEMSKITTAIALIGLGLWVILKPKNYKNLDNNFQNNSADVHEIKS